MATLFSLASFRNVYLLRGLMVWIGLRVAMAVGPGPLNPPPSVEGLAVCLVAVVVLLDARRRAEDLFLGNLGISAWAIALHGVPLALLAELLVP